MGFLLLQIKRQLWQSFYLLIFMRQCSMNSRAAFSSTNNTLLSFITMQLPVLLVLFSIAIYKCPPFLWFFFKYHYIWIQGIEELFFHKAKLDSGLVVLILFHLARVKLSIPLMIIPQQILFMRRRTAKCLKS